MAKIKQTPVEIWKEYEAGVGYKEKIKLFEREEKNWKFYLGYQWDGVNAPDLDKPVVNFLQRVVSYFVAMLVSDEVKVNVKSYEVEEDAAGGYPEPGPVAAPGPDLGMAEEIAARLGTDAEGLRMVAELLMRGEAPPEVMDMIVGAGVDPDYLVEAMLGAAEGMTGDVEEELDPGMMRHLGEASLSIDEMMELSGYEIERIMELNNMRTLNRDAIKHLAIDGDACMHLYYDPEARTGQQAQGMIRAELIENTNVIPSNPYNASIQDQQYVILTASRLVEEVREEAKANGVPEDQMEQIRENDRDRGGEESSDDYQTTTVLTKYWREGGTIHWMRVTDKVVIRKATDTGYRMYPISWANWIPKRNSFHGESCITTLIYNQIVVNKMYAMLIKAQTDTAFPKIIYDGTKIDQWTNQIGAIRVNGDPQNAVAAPFNGAQVNGTVVNLIQNLMSDTRDMMGASDAALGNVRPDNTSAIIAVQKATAVPLELQRIAYYQFVEDYVRVMLDMLTVDYGYRYVVTMDEDGTKRTQYIDFGQLRDRVLDVKVDVGAGIYFSELTQTQTLDNLMQLGLLNGTDYVESMPEEAVPNKHKLVEAVRRNDKMMQMMAMLQQENEQLKGELAAGAQVPPMVEGMPPGGEPVEAMLPVDGATEAPPPMY